MSYHADPGGVFDSDTHRRVLGHLHDEPLSAEELFNRMVPDVGSDLADADEAGEVLADLEADGYASQSKDGWKQTKKGLDALNAPVPETEG